MAGRGLPVTPSQFYVTLPSNSNPETFPNNTPSDYTVMLSSNIELDGPFEVALADMSIPQTWFNLGTESKGADDKDVLSIKLFHTTLFNSQVIYIPPGHYPSLSFLVTEINHLIKNDFKARETRKREDTGRPVRIPKDWATEVFFYHDDYKKVFLSVPKNVKIELSTALRDILGFRDTLFKGPYFNFAEMVGDIHSTLGALYVYCNIIENRRVGNVEAPLLRIVPLSKTNNQFVYFHSFHPLQFAMVKNRSFDQLSVNIRDGRGRLIPFQKGDAVLTLLFRRQLPF